MAVEPVEPIKRPNLGPPVVKGLQAGVGGGKKLLQLNIAIVIEPRNITRAVVDLVEKGQWTRREAIEYLQELIDAAEDAIMELTKR